MKKNKFLGYFLINKLFLPSGLICCSFFQSQVKSIKIMKEMQLERMEKVKHFRKDLNALGTEIRLLKERINTANSKMEKAREVLLKTEKFRLKVVCFLSWLNRLFPFCKLKDPNSSK